jgi:tRNA G18 (ribose-2'-O)-methylase SpoU
MHDTRNVIDFYKNWEIEAIRGDLDTKRHNFSILVSNQINDFNLSVAIRNSNAFLAKEVIIYGRRKWDRRGAVGTHLYENLKHVREIQDLHFDEGTTIVGIDNLPGAVPIETFEWPESPVVMVFGQESIGLTEELLGICHNLVYIHQYGSVRSLNVGCASAIAMYSYVLKHGFKFDGT